MKYIIDSIVKTKAKYLVLLDIILMITYLVLNAKILLWVSQAINYNSIDYVNLVLAACIAQIIISSVMGLTGFHRHISFVYLNEIFVNKILDSDMAMFNEYSPGVIKNAGEKIWQLTSLVALFIGLFKNALSVMINIIAIWLIQPAVVLPVAGIFIVCAIVVMILNKKWEKIDKSIETDKEKRNVELDEITNGFVEVRSFPKTIESHRSNIVNFNRSIMKLTFNRQKTNGLMNFVISLVDTLAMMVVLLYVVLNAKSGNINIAATTGITLVMYCWRIIDPLLGIVFSFSDISEYKAALPKFTKIMQYENKLKDGNIELESFDSDITIDNISFSYDGSDSVINGVSMKIPKGSRVGICGISGGGKSTLLKLLTRFYDVDSGSINIDGINIKDLKMSSLRKYIGIVHQSTYIFDGSIRDNIAYALRPSNPSDEVIMEACKKACIDNFIISLPEGLNTKVGPRGMKLSGGQKQRISLARIFLMDPEIVVLDEATSALDNETETVVQDALKNLNGKTIITIAHRLSTIKDSDMIYVINNHSIAECGNHNELIELKGLYYNMQK